MATSCSSPRGRGHSVDRAPGRECISNGSSTGARPRLTARAAVRSGAMAVVESNPQLGRQIVEDALRRQGVRLRDLDVRLELGLQESVRRAVEEGYGVTFISRTAVDSELATGRLVEARVEGLEATREISLASSSGRARSRVADAFVAFARERLAAGG